MVGYCATCTSTGKERKNLYDNNNNDNNNNILFQHSTRFFSDSRAESSYCELFLLSFLLGNFYLVSPVLILKNGCK